jgi:hypothetical protein
LHIPSNQLGEPSLDVVGVNERVGVGFKVFAAIKSTLAGAAVAAPAADPGVLGAFEPNVGSSGGSAFSS